MRILVLTIALCGAPLMATAHGCLKGAAAGAVVGHVAGHHAVVGAAAGCVIGHHRAAAQKREAARNRAQAESAATTGVPPAP